MDGAHASHRPGRPPHRLAREVSRPTLAAVRPSERPAECPPTQHDATRRRARWGLALASTAAILAVVEIALHMTGFNDQIFTSPDPVLGYALTPGLAQRQTLEGEALVTVNQDGFRDRDVPRAKPAGVRRVVVLGDSLTEGRQVDAGETYSAVMSNELARCSTVDGARVEVLNFGVAGYSTVQELLTYRHRARAWAPDVVVLMVYAPNDLDDNTTGARARHQPYYDLVDGELVLNTDFRASFSYRLRTSFLARAHVWGKGHVRLLHLVGAARRGYRTWRAPAAARPAGPGPLFVDPDGSFTAPTDPAMVSAWTLLERLLVELQREVERDGARLILANAPSPHAVHPDRTYRDAVASFYGVADLEYAERRLSRLAAATGVTFVPLAATLRAEADRSGQCLSGFANAVPCFGHWNQLGHRTVGVTLATALCTAWASGDRPPS